MNNHLHHGWSIDCFEGAGSLKKEQITANFLCDPAVGRKSAPQMRREALMDRVYGGFFFCLGQIFPSAQIIFRCFLQPRTG